MKTSIYIILIFIFGFTGYAQSESLNDYFRIAAENNPGLQAKYKMYEAALQKVPQVRSLPDPTFSFGYFLSSVETRVGAQQVKFSLTQMFPWFGTLAAQGDVAALLTEAKLQEFLDARNKLFYNVAAAYYPLFELEQLKSIENKNLQILDSYKSIATVKLENGKNSMTDVLRVEMSLADAHTNLELLNKKHQPLLTSFNKLLDRDETSPVQIGDTLQMSSDTMFSLKDSMLANNPLLHELQFKYRAALASEKAAIKQGLPKIGLGLDYVLVDKRTDMEVTDNGEDAIMPMLSLSIPIYRSKYKAAQEEARLKQQSYLLQREQVQNQLLADYEMLWYEINKQKDLITLFDTQISTSAQALHLLFTSYSNSENTIEEVLRMEQQLLKYQKMKVEALTKFYIAVEKMYYLTAKER